MDLVDACAIVTGGASGIGAATVDALHAVGARVAVIDRQTAPAADVSLVADVGDEAQVVGAVRDAADRLDGLDIAVVNAGIGGMSPILDLTTDEWDRVMSVNLRGAFVTLRESARAMVARERPGAIVAVTSVSGFLTDRSMAHYSVSKAGLAALVRVAAREFGPYGIRVNGVAPGTTLGFFCSQHGRHMSGMLGVPPVKLPLVVVLPVMPVTVMARMTATWPTCRRSTGFSTSSANAIRIC